MQVLILFSYSSIVLFIVLFLSPNTDHKIIFPAVYFFTFISTIQHQSFMHFSLVVSKMGNFIDSPFLFVLSWLPVIWRDDSYWTQGLFWRFLFPEGKDICYSLIVLLFFWFGLHFWYSFREALNLFRLFEPLVFAFPAPSHGNDFAF